MKIYLDDERQPPEGWTAVRTPTQFMETLQSIVLRGNWQKVEAISFDHDLGYFDENGKEVTGLDCLSFLEILIYRNYLDVPQLYIHTSNPSVKNNMIAAIENIHTLTRK